MHYYQILQVLIKQHLWVDNIIWLQTTSVKILLPLGPSIDARIGIPRVPSIDQKIGIPRVPSIAEKQVYLTTCKQIRLTPYVLQVWASKNNKLLKIFND